MANKKVYIVAACLVLALSALAIFLLVQRSANEHKGVQREPETAQESVNSGATRADGKEPILAPVRGSGSHTLSGQVRGADGSPVAMASISAQLELGPGVRGIVPVDAGVLGGTVVIANSNAQGEFVLEGLEAGRYRLLVEAPAILASEVRFVEAPGEGLQLLVSRAVEVRGRVLFNEQGVAGAKVYLQSESATIRHERVSDAEGKFHFADMAEGNFSIFAIGSGQAARSQSLTRLGVGPFAIAELRLEQAFTVQGRVVEAAGANLGVIADVRLRDEQGLEGERSARSLADGSFSIQSVLAGRWTAEAKSPGYLASAPISLLAEEQRSFELVLGEGAVVAGVVLGPNREAVSGAVVLLQGVGSEGESLRYSQVEETSAISSLGPGQRLVAKGELGVLLGPIPMPPPKGSSVTRVASLILSGPAEATPPDDASPAKRSQFISDARGEFRILGVEPGEYRLFVAHELWADMASQSFTLRDGRVPASHTLRMRAGTKLLGEVADDEGVPIEGASVLVEFADGRDPILSVSDAEGRFVIDAIVGEVTLAISAVGHTRSTQVRKLAPGTLTPVEERMEVRLARANLSIAGRVVDSSGFPVRGAALRVETTESNLPSRIVRSDADGLFQLEGLARGEHWIAATHAEYPEARARLSTEAPGEVVMPLGGVLEVSLRDRESQAAIAMAQMELRMEAKAAPPALLMQSDESGRAIFAALRPANYLLTIKIAGYAEVSQSTRISQGERAGEVTEKVVVELVRGATLAGIVRDSKGDRLIDATISSGSASSRTDKEGRFRLVDLASGEVRLRIALGKQSAEQVLELQAGEERVTVDLVFDPEAGNPGSQVEEEQGDNEDAEDSSDLDDE